jgi:hypothetical protein
MRTPPPPNDIDVEKLFEELGAENSASDLELGGNSLARCACGKLNNISRPMVCACGSQKLFWKTLEGQLLPLSKMSLGHLTNCVKFLAEKAAEGSKPAIEIALDLIYLEIGSREKEITQISGISAALQRSLGT